MSVERNHPLHISNKRLHESHVRHWGRLRCVFKLYYTKKKKWYLAHQYSVKCRGSSSSLNMAEYSHPGVVTQSLPHQLQNTHTGSSVRQIDLCPCNIWIIYSNIAGFCVTQNKTPITQNRYTHLWTYIFYVGGGDGLAICVDGSLCEDYNVESWPLCAALC